MILRALRRPEHRDGLPASARGIRTLFGWGPATKAGPRVSEQSALAHTTVYTCVRILSQVVAALPIHLIERQGNSRREAVGHPLENVLSRRANERHTAFNALQFLAASLVLRGNAVSYVQRTRTGEVAAYYPLRWDRVEVEIRDGEPVYLWSPDSAETRAFRRDEIWHIFGLSTDGTVGLSPISAQREAVGIGLAMQEYGARFFSNSATPDGVLTHPGTIGGNAEERAGALDRLRISWDQTYQGIERSHRVAILEEGMKWEPMGVAPRDAEFLEGKKFNRAEIAGMFGVPLHLIGDHERGDFSVGTISREFVDYSLLPWLRNIEQSISRDLLPAEQSGRISAKFNVDMMLRGQPSERAAFYTSGITGGWMSPNEARAKEDLNPAPGGDLLRIPLNMGIVDEDGDAFAIQSGPPQEARAALEDKTASSPVAGVNGEAGVAEPLRRRRLAQSFSPAVEDLVTRIGRREARELQKLVSTHFPESATEERGDTQLEQFRQALEVFYAQDSDFRAYLRDLAGPILGALQRAAFDAAAEETEGATDLDDLEAFFAALTATFGARYALSSLRSLEAGIEAEPTSPAMAVLASINLWAEARPQRVARRETRSQANAAAREAWQRSGVTTIRWRASGETCPFCRRLDGKVVGVRGGSFVAAGEEWEAEGRKPLKPRSKILHPPLHRGCDCQIFPGG